MITIISGTNRKGSLTKVFAKKYFDILSAESKESVQFLALEDMEHDWLSSNIYNGDEMPENLKAIQEQYILGADRFVVLSPEYNGSFPGFFKLFLDACSVRKYPENFKNKKIALVGVAAGRAGNLRGMGDLSAIFNHMGAVTMPNQLPLSSAKGLLDDNGQIIDEGAIGAMTAHAKSFLEFIK